MLLKSIRLINFRQFKNEYLEFASGEDGKNVTLILGENGTGKTTFAQAFIWCLYGTTKFSDKLLLNKKTASEMSPGSSETVTVELRFYHGELDYTVVRTAKYFKDNTNKVKALSETFNIDYRGEDGVTIAVRPVQRENEINGILPQDLSGYFFFDGERIENMSRDISSNKKSSDFSIAVTRLLGLNAMRAAIGHLNPGLKSSVYGLYASEFQGSNNLKLERISRELAGLKNTLDKNIQELSDIDERMEKAEHRKTEKIAEIKQYEDGAKKQQDLEKLEKRIDEIRLAQKRVFQSVCKDFNGVSGQNVRSFFSASMIERALDVLKNEEVLGKDIPMLHSRTIDYLLSEGVCVCGTHLDPGSLACKKLVELKNFLPPKSISNFIHDFKLESSQRINGYTDLSELAADNLDIISAQDDEITDARDDIHSIEEYLSGEDVSAKVKTIQSEITHCTKILSEDKARRDMLLTNKGGIEKDISRLEKEQNEIALKDAKFRKQKLYMDCAKRIFDDLSREYTQKESEIRERLEKTINQFFYHIYKGGLVLSIDDKYHISVSVKEYDGEVETSTAQSISVIFAFISSIIKIARDNRNSGDEQSALLTSEPYPLVMDAPLSALDKRRIKSVCELLPNAAEQVIIFIKDTDGELAETHLGNKIGKRHTFKKSDEFETVVE